MTSFALFLMCIAFLAVCDIRAINATSRTVVNTGTVSFQLTLGLSHVSGDSLDLSGIQAVVDTVKKALNADQVVFWTQKTYSFAPGVVVASLSVFAKSYPIVVADNNINLENLYSADNSIDLDTLYSFLVSLMSTIVDDNTFTDLLQENAVSYGASGMENVKADYATPSMVNFDGRHDSYEWNAGGIAGVVLGTFFGLLLCCFCSFMYIKHRSDYGLAPNEPPTDEHSFDQI